MATRLRSTLLAFVLILLACAVHAQVLFQENFDGGASTTGFTIDMVNQTDCRWEYAPSNVGEFDFSQDIGNHWPAGPGFDSSFVFLDTDACGGNSVVVDSYLYSAPFDASATGVYVLSFSQQFQARLASFTSVQVSPDGGGTWTEVQHQTGTSVGYPNPAVRSTVDITAACASSASAQVRFQFNAGWDWWWALDSISVTHENCAFPANLAVSNITTSGATFAWDDNGSTGYEWVVTTGAVPNGTNAVTSGDGSNLTASGLTAASAYTVFVRAQCTGGGTSAWSSGVLFTTAIENDECLNATPVIVNIDATCDSLTHGTVIGATGSGITSTCFGTADDDVWFSFTALAATQHISLLNVSGSTGDMYMAVWSGSCGSLSLVPNSCSDPQEEDVSGLVPGQPYYLQVYTWTSTPDQTSQFDVCISASASIGMEELAKAAVLELYPNPTEGSLRIRCSSGNARRMLVTDAVGRTVSSGTFSTTLDTHGMQAGAYVLTVLDADGTPLARRTFVKR